MLSLRVSDLAPHGYALDRVTIRQRETGRPVKFELTEQMRDAVDAHLRGRRNRDEDFVFEGRGAGKRPLTTRQ